MKRCKIVVSTIPRCHISGEVDVRTAPYLLSGASGVLKTMTKAASYLLLDGGAYICKTLQLLFHDKQGSFEPNRWSFSAPARHIRGKAYVVAGICAGDGVGK